MSAEQDDVDIDAEGVDEAAQIEALSEELAAAKDKWLRSVAELDNYKKRVRREIDDAVFRARQDLLSDFLSTVDNLERALELAAGQPQLAKGIEMVLKGFLGALGKHGIEPVPSVGTPFDPAIHEALQQVDSPDHAPGTVITEFEKGYRVGGRLLRAARVIIAGAGSTGGAS
ncbi:MAG: nucleotide exchange factor GrpE [Myxococcales bacterium]|nr:nucleotide exchange factor GrpE [Myxococcales bacterium]MCB9568449.1 nucleotide exchange factor GrpE [Myxococcales bacterium]MCB9702064.1 nucleotide exchange factor GrpE [Myxococcales bacterium]